MVLAAGIVLVVRDDLSTLGGFGCVFGGLSILILTLCLIILPMEVGGEMQAYYATRSAIENARETGMIENAAMQLEIIDINKWLAKAKYWNGKFPAFYPGEIVTLEALK